MHTIDCLDFIWYLSSLYLYHSPVLWLSLLSATLLAWAFNWCIQSLFAIETPQSDTTLLPQRPQDLRDLLITHSACRLSCKRDYCGHVATEGSHGSMGNGERGCAERVGMYRGACDLSRYKRCQCECEFSIYVSKET